jgi:hypothetical protein
MLQNSPFRRFLGTIVLLNSQHTKRMEEVDTSWGVALKGSISLVRERTTFLARPNPGPALCDLRLWISTDFRSLS